MHHARPFRHVLTVAFSDTDAAQVVWFGNFLRYVEAAETALFDALGFPLGPLFEQQKLVTPRTHLTCGFRAPARFGDRLVVTLTVTTITESRVGFAYVIAHDASGQVVSEGAYRIACVDLATFVPRPFPSGIVAALAAIAGPTA